MKRNIALLLCLFVFCACDTSESSNEFPSKPFTYIVPWSPGGGTDISARTMAVSLQNVYDKPINVVNRTGGGGVVGHLATSKARPDGHTLGAITMEICMLHWMGRTDLNYKNYTPLALIMNNPASVTVRADAPWNSVEELLEAVKNEPGKHKASGTARGGIWDLARIGMLKAAGIDEKAMPWVPSQGAAPALNELIAGGVDVVTAAVAEVDALRQAGQVRVLAAMAPERIPSFPEIPTLKEQGIDWELGGWVGLGAPANLSVDVVANLDSAIYVAFQNSDFQQSMGQAGFNLQYLSSADFGEFMAKQDELLGNLMKETGLGK